MGNMRKLIVQQWVTVDNIAAPDLTDCDADRAASRPSCGA
jgi:hypothetical protein